jgi:cytidylate kinase
MNERSTTTVLTISRQLGSGGSYIGQEVARRLEMRYADREILQRAAAAAGVGEGDLAGAEEKGAGFWHSVVHSFSLGGPDTTFVPPPLSSVYEDDVFAIESKIIREIASQFDAVIVGRAGFHVLAGHPGLVNVMLHARDAWRVERIMRVYRIEDRREAEDLVKRSDRTRADFIRAFTGRHWTDARLFDLCIDTSSVGLERANEIVVALVSECMARRRMPAPDPVA